MSISAINANASTAAQAAFHHALPPGAFAMRYARDQEIYGEEEKADYVYTVISGAVRTSTVLADGRRQIDAFHLPGDIFGLEMGNEHRFSAEAIAECEIAVIPRAALERAAERDGEAARKMWGITAEQLRRVRDHMLILGKRGAMERVVCFLMEMSSRGRTKGAIDLPMSRTDIADYLGLTIETVSRCFSRLERERAIALKGARHVVVNNLDVEYLCVA